MMAKVSEARVSRNKVTDSPAKARTFNFARKFLERITERSGKKERMLRSEMNISRRAFGKVLMGILAGAAATSAPSLLRADERVARAEVSKESSIRYETFSDPAELEPYFKNAEDKLVSIKQGEVKKIGEFEVWIKPWAEDPNNKFGTEFRLRDPNGKEYEFNSGALQDINILEVNLGNHPYFKSMTLFVGKNGVTYAAKTVSGYLVEGVSFVQARMRDGPIRAGLEEKGDSLFVISSPKNIKEGDVVCQAEFGASGFSRTYFKYSKSQPPGTMVASL
jgi:hypothetical protein